MIAPKTAVMANTVKPRPVAARSEEDDDVSEHQRHVEAQEEGTPPWESATTVRRAAAAVAEQAGQRAETRETIGADLQRADGADLPWHFPGAADEG